ncbi:MAG: nitroreductase family protein [Myxococcota bacterium]|nr:nitroreductase family protein [Myxococcota bacterium]
MDEPEDWIPYRREKLDDQEMLQRVRSLGDELALRRTVRRFSTDPIPFEVIQACVQAASTAPSGAHRQPWHFVAIQDPALKAQIREAAEQEERRNYESRFPDTWKQALKPFNTDANKPYLTEAPWLIAVFAVNQGEQGKNYYVTESVGLATGMLLAAINRANLVAVTHTPSPMKFLKDILERPAGERAWLLLAVGHPAPDVKVPDLQRKALEQVLTRR